MAETSELKPKSFRIDDETNEKLKLIMKDFPMPGPSRRREGHGHWVSGRPQEGGAALKLLTRWCHLVLRLLVPVACW